ncbi:hypothetical protein [Autumnicola edwardsiae]|uniref:Uncharacterized protein n=1 Tax=Autumnicola edwardsiae TaxID=3075594 RepID=A0ABU3CXW9_9FLAO|nr:hypothetical protein [Zunongwangia sp. F297]MDT0651215.1 hypothetical protein [Zunongwangia sp. F297]
MSKELFKGYEKRLNVLEEPVRTSAIKYAEIFFQDTKCTIEEALEKGIAKAEMEQRNL